MATNNDGSNKVRPPGPPTEDDAMLTRSSVASIFGCSPSTVRRMEGEVLHPTLDAKGVHRFSLLEVLQVQKQRSAQVGSDPTKEGERDGRAFELLNAGNGIRHLVTRLRIPADVAKRLAETWREAGRDVVVPAACKAELTRYLGNFGDAAELVQRARAASAESKRRDEEHMQLHTRVDNLVVLLGELAARVPALEQVLPEVKAKLDSELVELLEQKFEAFSQQRASVEPAARRNEAVVPCEIASPDVIRDEEVCASACALASSDAPSDATPTSTAVAAGDAAGPANSDAIPCADGCSRREQLLDAWLTSLGADDARLPRLAALLERRELEMFAELERGIGAETAIAAAKAESGSAREQLLDALLVSIAKDDARLERIGALLTLPELDLLVELRKRNAGA